VSDEVLLDLMGFVERFGVWLSLAAWATVAGAVVAMAVALRRERRLRIWSFAVGVAVVALAANLVDYAVTLSRSPDLALEANPLWRNVVDSYGIELAKLYGVTGKILVSALAGLMFAFYLSNIERLYPRRAGSIVEFARRLGERSKTPGERALALFTLFAFLFSGIQLLYFYIAYLNGIEDPARFDRLPSVTAAIAALIGLLVAFFLVLTYRNFRRSPSAASR